MRQELLSRIASGDTAFHFEAPTASPDEAYSLVRKDGCIVAVVHHPAYENWSDRFLDSDDKYVALFKKKGRVNFFCVTLYEEDIAWADLHPFEQELLVAETCSVIAKQFLLKSTIWN